MRLLLIAAAALAFALPTAAQTPALKPSLAGVAFLIGDWSSGTGKVADTGETSTGSSRITVEIGGAALLRRDHTELRDAAGKPSGGFDQIMLIYPEGDTLHGDYSDGTHVIHYTSAVVIPGKSVAFTSAAGGGPVFKLGYSLTDPKRLAIDFEMAAPGSTAFHPIATGSITRLAP